MQEIIRGKTPNQRLWIVIILAIGLSLIEMVAQVSIKHAREDTLLHSQENKTYLLVAIVFYTVIVLLLFYSYNFEGLGHMNMVWSCVSIVLAFVIGYIFFKEPFNKFTILAIILASFAIYFAHLADERG